ncbi:PREDICTED: complement decay-accelerating factor, GPI-anchored-like [Ceratotherium simum simum]|uniref:Complement decay-accelerating factor, GPI-anchored-like n=1 Tax=Ceratotherium simum simum TaxID=73337 RepID=A0ABM1CGW1_CERSS|nr:PREDICTED: complement decay-accelerating factor, GPI-anchored-like [Ceratotherium simum simum]
MRLRGVAQATYNPGDTIEYECRLGYKLKRPPLATSAVCQSDSTWTPLQEACTRKLCRHPGEPTNGQVKYVNGTLEFGSQIHYVCNEGFNLIGQNILYCELVGENVDWSDNPPLCQDACGDPPRFNSMKLKGVAQSAYNPGDTIEYDCCLGYKLKRPPLPTSAVCQSDNKWTPLQEACTRKLCPHPGEPTNGEVKYVNGTLELGSQIHYVCNEGFNLIGQNILYCELVGENVDWSDNPPLCQVMSCSPPPKIQNGKYTRRDQEEFTYNDVVTYSCDPSDGPDEYSLVGESRLVCSGNDKWSSDPPECKGQNVRKTLP